MLELAWTLHGYCVSHTDTKERKESALAHLLCNFMVLGQSRKHMLTHLSVNVHGNVDHVTNTTQSIIPGAHLLVSFPLYYYLIVPS